MTEQSRHTGQYNAPQRAYDTALPFMDWAHAVRDELNEDEALHGAAAATLWHWSHDLLEASDHGDVVEVTRLSRMIAMKLQHEHERQRLET